MIMPITRAIFGVITGSVITASLITASDFTVAMATVITSSDFTVIAATITVISASIITSSIVSTPPPIVLAPTLLTMFPSARRTRRGTAARRRWRRRFEVECQLATLELQVVEVELYKCLGELHAWELDERLATGAAHPHDELSVVSAGVIGEELLHVALLCP